VSHGPIAATTTNRTTTNKFDRILEEVSCLHRID
jgi:hypothetical protein